MCDRFCIEKNIGDYIRLERVSLSEISRKTGIPYHSLYSSLLSNSHKRELRSSELIAVCKAIGKEITFFLKGG